MKLKLHENSLFAVLLRAQWWVSGLVGVGMFFLVRAFLPVIYAVFAALPFWGISLWVLRRELRRPSAKKIAATLERARSLPADDFLKALEEGFRKSGYSVSRTTGSPADLELFQEGRLTLVICRRWKASRTGVEPLRDFDAATAERGAFSRIYVAAGEITDQARAFAAEKRIRLVGEEELTRLLL